jgi:TolA-binding protein
MKRFIILSVACLMLASCAYYNTFYNARKFFESAQKRPLNAQGRPNAQAIEEYNKVIRKCGTVIEDFPDSKWVEEATFLWGRALFYRRQNQLQAIEKFEELIQNFPDSKFLSDAIIYIAKIRHSLNQKDEAYEILRNFIQNPANRDHHPKALIEIADLYISDGNFMQAQFYLSILTERHAKSKLYTQGYFLLGKSFFDNNNFERSLEVFNDITRLRAPKSLKNDATYYIAYSLYHLGNYQRSYNIIKALQKKEFRTDKAVEQNILQARIMAEMGRIDEAISMLEGVTTTNPRSFASAEAVFHIGELYFRKLHDYDKAIENFNRVRRESQTSPFVEMAVSRSAVVSQILQYYRQYSTMPTDMLIAEQFKLAEYYLYELSQPDSALVIYSKIPIQAEFIRARIDSLENALYLVSTDSWSPLQTNIADDTLTDDDISMLATWKETVDELLTPEEIESLLAEENEPDVSTPQRTKDEEIDAITQRLAVYKNDLISYQEIFIPHSYFVKMVIYRQFFQNEERVQHYFQLLGEHFPQNRYTESASEFLSGVSVTYLTHAEKHQLSMFEYAMDYYNLGQEIFLENLPHIVSILDSLTTSSIDDLAHKSLYTLGFIYYFDLSDTLMSKVYLDSLLAVSPRSDYATFTKMFYDGEHFIQMIDRLPSIVEHDIRKAELQVQMPNEQTPLPSPDVSIKDDYDFLDMDVIKSLMEDDPDDIEYDTEPEQ